MSALPILIGWLMLAAEPTPPTAQVRYLPSGRPAELHDLGRLARLRDPRARAVAFSSREPLGTRDGRTVLAETSGPGIVQRLWVAEPKGDLARPTPSGAGRIRVHIDGRAEPVLNATIDELSSGRHPSFPGVVNGGRPGGFVAYTPMAFRDGCLITLEGGGERDYEVGLLALPSAEGLTSFRAQPTSDDAHALQLAHALAREPEAIFSNEPSYSRQRLWRELSIRRQAEDAEYLVDGTDRSSRLFALPAGPRTIRSFDIVLDPKTTENWRAARLRIVWEGDDPADAAVDVPFSEFFGLLERGLTYRSLLTGENEHVWSNRFPMPYERGATVVIDAEGPIRGVVRVRTLKERSADAGYLRASTQAARDGVLEWGEKAGRGHLVGTFFTAAGRGERAVSLAETLSLMADDRPLLARGVPLIGAFDAAWPDVKDRLDMSQTFPLSGFPVYRRDGERWCVAAYRWRLTDPVPFERSIALRIGPDNAAGATPPDDVRATVFWYSERSGPARAGRPR
ncbi:MAG: DUF2961 domain-containing protein [Isosphaeraceae bacterium]|nr:DUF2961 domain-containing protein [Isosphaeraceae bacterium]